MILVFPDDFQWQESIFDGSLDKYHTHQETTNNYSRQLGELTHSHLWYALFSEYYDFPVAVEEIVFGGAIFSDDAALGEEYL